MMKTKTMVRNSDGLVVNIISLPDDWDDNHQWPVPEGHSLINHLGGSVGDTWNGSQFIPLIPPEDPRPSHMVPSVEVSFLSSTSCNGVYSLSETARTNILAIYTRIMSNHGLPGGGETLLYPDKEDVMHEFSSNIWVAFALAISDFVYALDQGQNPSEPIVINA